ncbi:hypothetical protein PO909_021929 [Leuciscus waleckii]
MGGSQQTKKQSPARTGGSRLTPHTPRHTHAHGRSGQTRHTPRSSQARTGAARKQAVQTHTHTHSRRSSFAQGSLARAGNGHTDQGGCGLFCYLCYSGYCLCLMLLSFFLLLLLSPPTSRTPPPSPPPSSPLPPSPSDDTIFSLSFSSLAIPFCPHPSLNLSSSPMSPFLPLQSLTNSLTLLHPDSELIPFNFSSPLSSCPSASSDPPSTSYKSSSGSPPQPRPFVLVPPSLLLLPRPSLCRSLSSSSRSLPSLLLCPHSLSDHTLSSTETLDQIPSMGAIPRPRTLLRQQSLQQPLIQAPAPNLINRPPNSQSLGQLHTQPGLGGGGGAGPGGGTGTGSRNSRGGPAGASRYRSGGASHGNPGSVDHMMGQITKRGLDVKSFLEGKMVVLSLAIGLAEHDDFANLPDLQEVPPSQETPPDKRYLSEYVCVCVCGERCITCLTNPQQAVELLLESRGLWVIPSIACIRHRL